MRSAIVAAGLIAASAALAGCAAPNAVDRPATTAEAKAGEGEVRALATAFVTAFNGLDAPAFDALWAEDASVFFPQRPFPIRRVEGRAEVLRWFHRFFDAKREDGDSPGVDPKQLAIQMLGRDSALVHFHLGSDADAVARRTLVLRRDSAGWRIVHLHASSLAAPKPTS